MADSVPMRMQETDEEMAPPMKHPSDAKGWTRYMGLPLLTLALGGTFLFATSIGKPAVGASIATPGVIVKTLTNGDVIPDFKATTTTGKIKFHEWIGGRWSLLIAFGHTFEPVGLGELVQMSKNSGEFDKRNVKLIALTPDDVESQKNFIEDVKKFTDNAFEFPMISDETREVSVAIGLMEDPDEKSGTSLFNTAFIIGADKKVKTKMQYAAHVGLNFDEIIRVIDALQLTAVKKVATPANWKMGDEALVLPSVKDDDLDKLFPQGVRVEHVPSGKNYLRFTTDYQ